MTASEKPFDIVVFGASGYTGRLVTEYLDAEYGDSDLRWAMAGRSLDKLTVVRSEMGISDTIALLEADVDDPVGHGHGGCLQSRHHTVALSTLWQRIVKQCAERGTDYVDLTGEPSWMHETIAQYSEAAKASGARIVHSCGFDSIPFDLGVYLLQQHAISKTGAPIATVKGRVRAMNGTFSGGTIASMRATMASAKANPAIIQVLTNPFALTEGLPVPSNRGCGPVR